MDRLSYSSFSRSSSLLSIHSLMMLVSMAINVSLDKKSDSASAQTLSLLPPRLSPRGLRCAVFCLRFAQWGWGNLLEVRFFCLLTALYTEIPLFPYRDTITTARADTVLRLDFWHLVFKMSKKLLLIEIFEFPPVGLNYIESYRKPPLESWSAHWWSNKHFFKFPVIGERFSKVFHWWSLSQI